MNINTAAILSGGALITWRGTSFYHRGPLTLPLARETKEYNDIEPFAQTFQAHEKPDIVFNFTPSGRVAEVQNVINRYAASVRGDQINVEEFPVTVNPATDELTTNGAKPHLCTTGDEVMMSWVVDGPAGGSRTTRYNVRVASPTAVTLHTSKAGAIANTGKVDLTSTGTGVILNVTRPLVLWTRKGLRITYWNVGLVKVPDLRLTAGDTLLGDLSFRAFVRNGQDPDDPANAYYDAPEYAAFTDTSFATADMVRQSPKVTWANGAPWSAGLTTKAGVVVSQALGLSSLNNDAFGENALAQYFNTLDVSVTADVQGVTEVETKTALAIHTAKRGDDSGGAQLNIDTTKFNFRIAKAFLAAGPQNFTATDQRAGSYVWKNTPNLVAGVMDPPFQLTTNP